MKTTIIITGQFAGNIILKNAIQTNNCEVKKHFNNFTIVFNSKKEVVKALQEANQYMIRNGYNIGSWFSYTRGKSISYDASIARLIT
jgi:ferritin-like metal-binding protein YciE